MPDKWYNCLEVHMKDGQLAILLQGLSQFRSLLVWQGTTGGLWTDLFMKDLRNEPGILCVMSYSLAGLSLHSPTFGFLAMQWHHLEKAGSLGEEACPKAEASFIHLQLIF